jgi:hypothetical protein
MNFKITLLSLLFVSIIGQGQTPTFQNTLANTKGNVDNYITSIVNDANGNTYFCGNNADTLKIGNIQILPGNGGAFVGKLNAAGTLAWIKRGGTSSGASDIAYDVKLDNIGNLYVAGKITGNLVATFDGITLNSPYQGFVAKYSTQGNIQWVQGYGGNVYSIAIDQNNNPFINLSDGEIYKLDPANGNQLNSALIGGNLMSPQWHNIVIDNNNNVIIGVGNKIRKFDNNLNQIWNTPISASLIETYRISLDNSGNVYGTYYALFGTVTVGNISKSNFPNGYMFKLDATTGNPLLVDSIRIGGQASKIKEVIIDAANNYYFSGDGAFNAPHVLKTDNAYNVIWDKSLPTNAPANDIALLSDNCLIVAGGHQGTSVFDATTVNAPNGNNTLKNTYITGLCTGTVSLDDHKAEPTFTLSPNPASSSIIINGNFNASSTYAIYNSIGKMMKNGQLTNTIEVSKLPDGLYFISIFSAENTSSKALIINH